jgi:hypothetical protein
MEIKIQFETADPLPEQEGIRKIEDLSYVVSYPDSFKYECNHDWAQGKDIPVEQVIKGLTIMTTSSYQTCHSPA